MTAIQWLRLNNKSFEDMVACVLSHENPKVRRIDGSGGDKGRDCQFDSPEGLHAFQIKHFPGGRMGKSQRRQVIKSLQTVMKLNPVDWVLIVPFDHTPDEKTWFEGLPAKLGFDFPIEWRGKTWLDLEFAQRRFIYDYYVGDTKAEVYDLVREIREEEAALSNGVPDAVARAERLVQRANTLDPHYRFAIATDGSKTQVTIIPAYAGAEEDRPITVNVEFRFDTKTEEGRAQAAEFERAMEFGTPVSLSGDVVPRLTLDAPAGLGGTFEGPSVEMGPGKPVTNEPIDMTFTIKAPGGGIRATLTLTHIPETSGQSGTVLRGKDRAGLVESEVIIDVKAGKYRIKFHTEWNRFVPHDFAPIAKFLAEYHTPNSVSVARTDGTMQSDPYPCSDEIGIPLWAAEFVSNLAFIQAAASIVREVDGKITPDDVTNAKGGAVLLRGGEVPKLWDGGTLGLRASASLAGRQELAASGVRMESTVEAPVMLDICGTTYPVGARYRMKTVARVHPDSRPALLADPLTEDIEVMVLPDPDEPSALVKLLD